MIVLMLLSWFEVGLGKTESSVSIEQLLCEYT